MKPDKRSHRPDDQTAKFGVVFAWYSPEQWDRLREVSVDGDELEATHREWVAGAERAFRKLEKKARRRGDAVVKRVFVDVDDLVQWCENQGRAVDAAARAEFATEKARAEDQSP